MLSIVFTVICNSSNNSFVVTLRSSTSNGKYNSKISLSLLDVMFFNTSEATQINIDTSVPSLNILSPNCSLYLCSDFIRSSVYLYGFAYNFKQSSLRIVNGVFITLFLFDS